MVLINKEVVEKLINEQFPEWSVMEIKPVKVSGNDNRTFHLGREMSVRLPSSKHYVPQVEKEQKWLPLLAKSLSLPIPRPLAKGKPSYLFPFPWSVNQWLEGESLARNNLQDLNELASDLGAFLKQLQSIDTSGGPMAGEHNFYRGGDLEVYDHESTAAIAFNQDLLNVPLLNEIWRSALDSKWEKKPVWVHGDVAPGNLLVKDGKLSAVIDFGILGMGDPACDAAMAWTYFDRPSREIFKKALSMDDHTWQRARGWALWKALITFDEHRESNELLAKKAYKTIQVIEREFQSK